MTAMPNWYRALPQGPPDDRPSPRVVVPTTIIWGLKDFALRGVMGAESAAECDDVELIVLPEGRAWLSTVLAGPGSQGTGRVTVLLGGSGGVGTSTLAASTLPSSRPTAFRPPSSQ